MTTSLYTKTFEWHPILKPIAIGAFAVGTVALARLLMADRRPHRAISQQTAQKFAKQARGVAQEAQTTARSWLRG